MDLHCNLAQFNIKCFILFFQAFEQMKKTTEKWNQERLKHLLEL